MISGVDHVGVTVKLAVVRADTRGARLELPTPVGQEAFEQRQADGWAERVKLANGVGWMETGGLRPVCSTPWEWRRNPVRIEEERGTADGYGATHLELDATLKA